MSDTRVILLGVGAIGRELLRQLATNPRASVRSVRVCALIDRSGFVFEPNGLSWRRVMELRAHKANVGRFADVAGGHLATAREAIDSVRLARGGRTVLIDATASDTRPLLETALTRGWDLVLANKLPLAGAQQDVDRLHRLAEAKGRQLLHEATVGAGLPVIDTLRKLLESGDRIAMIEGCPSGTLGYLFGELGAGRSFSDSLRSAIAAGYTEPDPRTDLTGLDVARKALILGRLLGFRGELGDIETESLVPPSLEHVPVAEFIERISEVDAEWEARVRAARSRGAVLRYRARVSRKAISVALAEVGASDPLGRLNGTDNQFSFTTTRYREQPLVITGPGAGPAVTAAGVYNDLLSIAGARALRAASSSHQRRRPSALSPAREVFRSIPSSPDSPASAARRAVAESPSSVPDSD